MKFKASGATYLDSENSNSNFSNSNILFSGVLHDKSSKYRRYKTLINFDLSRLDSYPIETAYLCLFVSSINSDSSYFSNNLLSVNRNISNLNLKSVNWDTSPSTDSPIDFSIDPDSVGKYVSLNITHLIRYWIESGKNYGISIEEQNFYSSLIQFNSINSNNPPWLLIEYKSS